MALAFEDGMAAYQRGDYATAMRLWRPIADQGGVNPSSFTSRNKRVEN
jgi:TPR repeat protein